MHPSTNMPYFGEPWTQRLRATPSRSLRTTHGRHQLDHLPSPKPTNPSSTDHIHPSSSSAGHKPKPSSNSLNSLRERLKPPPKRPAPFSPRDAPRAIKKPVSKPSVAPFFRRIEAAFDDKPSTNPAHKLRATTALRSARSPTPEAEDLLQQLKEHYLETATSLHSRATVRLSHTHTLLTHKLTQSLTLPDEAFLAETDAQIARLTQPLGNFRIRSTQRSSSSSNRGSGNGSSSDGVVRSEENSVSELVARAEEQVGRFETEVRGLWREWVAAEGEVEGLLRGGTSTPLGSSGSTTVEGVVAVRGGGHRGGRGEDGDGDGAGEELVRRFGEAVRREIAAAEAEVEALGEEAVAVMKGIEKDFRKATLPDLHIFFQSIDEP